MIFSKFGRICLSFILIFLFFNLSLFCQGQETIDIGEEIETVTSLPKICISGILFGENPTAIINGQILGINDSIQGATISQITSSFVSFEYQGLNFQKTEGQGCEDKSGLPKHRRDFSDSIRKVKKSFNFNQVDYKGFNQVKSLKELERELEQSMALVWLVFLIVGIPSYIYFSITLQIVARKTNTGPAWLAWIPGANVFLMCAIAQKSIIWTVFILFLPVTLIGAIPAIIMMYIVFMEMAAVCGKSKWLAILTLPIVPFGPYIYWGYLAFSKINFDESKSKVERIPGSQPQPQPQPQPESQPESEESPSGNDEDPPIYEG